MNMSKVVEFYGYSAKSDKLDWNAIVKAQLCPFRNRVCTKIRKSSPDVSIGTCTVKYGKTNGGVIICPFRLLERQQIFFDCLQLLQLHVPGNELHVIPEVAIPGGNVDYFLVSATTERRVVDFVGIELQTLDTTGTLWPERQKLLEELNISHKSLPHKNFGMNWKMTAKTILVQLHHKIETFENLNRHLVLVIQDCLLDYMKKEFDFSRISDNARLGDSMQFHVYSLSKRKDKYILKLNHRYSTDSNGLSTLLGLHANPNIDFDTIASLLEEKLTDDTLLHF